MNVGPSHAAPTYITLDPPPPPVNPFDSLYKYIAKTIRYPLNSRKNHVEGREIVRFKIVNGKIENLKVLRSLDADIDAEIVKVIKSFNGPAGAIPATYDLPIAFTLQTNGVKIVENTPDKNKVKANDQPVQIVDVKVNNVTTGLMLEEIVVTGYSI
ncbi:energy transducer TonB [Mucilaginibacter sp.]|uniref:energy transducer TonB n=1 Tax=Mucilaginibacter sp. TaxID=1882438 RepID=UPI003D0F1A39